MSDRLNLNVLQVAQRFGCSTDAVYGMIHRGELVAFRVGAKLWRVRLSEVERWEKSGETLKSTDTDSDTSGDKSSPHGEEASSDTDSGSVLPPPKRKLGRYSGRSSPAA